MVSRARMSLLILRVCIDGGGWRIDSLAQEQLADAGAGGFPLEVNRMVACKGNISQVVY